ncbi:MAG: TRAP transporter small permease [Desulfuromonadaceae bacterium]|nr:TRAP transporter small permease [Desulfuromonas sp.]MDY0184884.1 TRAP transporter small permease [Desulfuromonadaceae bacterium]
MKKTSRKILRKIDKTLGAIEDWSLVVVVGIALISGLANIILRKTTTINLYWSDEVIRKSIYFCTYIGCSAAVRHRSLIRVDALPQIFPVTRKFFNFVSHLASLVFSTFLIWLGWGLLKMVYADEYATTATLQIPEWYFYAILPLVGCMMFIRILLVMWEDLFGRVEAEPLAVATEELNHG